VDRWQRTVAQGVEHQSAGRYAQAERLFDAARRLAEGVGDGDRAELARAELGRCLIAQGREAEGDAALGQALTHFLRRLRDPTLPPETAFAFAEELTHAAARANDTGRADAALDLARRAAAATQGRLGESPGVAAQGLFEQGRAQRALGALDQAAESFRGAADGFGRVPGGGGQHGRALALEALGEVLFEGGRLDEAEAALMEAYAGLQSVLGQSAPEVGWVLATLASVLRAQGRHDQAAAFLQRSIQIEQSAPSPDAAALVPRLTELADLLSGQQRQGEAQSLLLQAVQWTRAGGRVAGETIALTHRRLAELYWDLGQLGDAIAAARAGLQAAAQAGDAEGLEVAALLNVLASLLYEGGAFEEAEAPAGRSFALFEALAQGSEEHASALNLLGLIARARGAHGEAKQLLYDSATIMSRVVGAHDPRVTSTVHNLAGAALDLGEPATVEGVVRWALDAALPVYGAADPGVAALVGDLERILRAQGRHGEADALRGR